MYRSLLINYFPPLIKYHQRSSAVTQVSASRLSPAHKGSMIKTRSPLKPTPMKEGQTSLSLPKNTMTSNDLGKRVWRELFPLTLRHDATGGLIGRQKTHETMADTVIMYSLGARSSYGWTCAYVPLPSSPFGPNAVCGTLRFTCSCMSNGRSLTHILQEIGHV